jgi:apolipoprotein N-acyltransferase
MVKSKERKNMSGVEAIIEIFANNPPSIAIALGFLLLLFGYIMDENGLVVAGWAFFLGGFALQILWLYFNK